MLRPGRRVTLATSLGLLASAIAREAAASNVTEAPDNGSEQMGRGGAWIARASDPLATAFNPAGLAGQSTRLTLQTSLVVHRTCFSRWKAAGDTSIDPLADATGRFPRVCNDIEPSIVPQLGAALRLGERLGVGIAFVSPAAAGTKTFPDFIEDGSGQRRPAPQRYLLLRQAGIIAFPTLGVGYEVLPGVRLGASFGWGFAQIKNAAATVALNGGGQGADNDVRANAQVSDYFVPRIGAGALWSVTPNLDLAAYFQWTDAIRARGDIGTATSYYGTANARGDERSVGYGDTIFSDCGTGRTQDAGKCGDGGNARLKLPVPMEAKLALRFHQPRASARPGGQPFAGGAVRDPLATDIFDLEVDFTWADNSAIDTIELRLPGDASGAGRLPVSGINSEIPANGDQSRFFRDVLGVRVGGDWNVVPDSLALRAGAYLESSAANERFQHLDFAPSRRFGIAFGATYRIRLGRSGARNDAIELMAGYGHTFFAEQSRLDRGARGIGALAGAPCAGDATLTGPLACSDGSPRNRTSYPVNLGTITNALNVINLGVAYRF